MTIQEMYQEIEYQQMQDNLTTNEFDLYDDCYIVEIDYTTQE